MSEVIDIVPARERLEHASRVRERQEFEDALQAIAYKWLRGGIAAYIGDTRKSLFHAIGGNLIRRLKADAAFLECMRELQRLPIGEESGQQRLAAFELGVQQYLPAAVREELPEFGTISITTLRSMRGNL